MNGAYVHLVLNHVPVVGLPLCWLLMVVGVWRRQHVLLAAALVGFVLMGAVSVPVFLSGDAAADRVRQWATIDRSVIHTHEEAGEGVAVAAGVLAAAALFGLWRLKTSGMLPKALLGLLLAGGLFVSCWLGWVAHLGGLIRHPEIGSGSPTAQTP